MLGGSSIEDKLRLDKEFKCFTEPELNKSYLLNLMEYIQSYINDVNSPIYLT